MGVDYVRKALLLDEAEHCSRQGAPLEALAADAIGMTLDPLGKEMADRGLEPLALLSERHDATVVLSEDFSGPCWLTEGTDWRTGVARICREIGGLARDDIARLEADPADFIARVNASVRAHLDEGVYREARRLCTALDGYARTGLPGFDTSADPTARDVDAAIDWRFNPVPKGTRLIVEFAVFWA